MQWIPTEGGSRLAAFDVRTGAVAWSRAMEAASFASIADNAIRFVEMLSMSEHGGRGERRKRRRGAKHGVEDQIVVHAPIITAQARV